MFVLVFRIQMPVYKKSGPIVHGGEFLTTRTAERKNIFFSGKIVMIKWEEDATLPAAAH